MTTAKPTREAARQALLQAATDIFLAEGFRAARVQDIAQQAGVRLSAINYHFGHKEGLYQAVLQHHADIALTYAPLPQPDLCLSLEQRFRLLIRALVTRFLDPATPSQIGRLLVREAVNPTGAIDMMFQRYTIPQSQIIFALLQECLGAHVPITVLMQTALSVMGQIIAYVTLRPVIERFSEGVIPSPTNLDALVEHITCFSWAGIQAIAQREAKA